MVHSKGSQIEHYSKLTKVQIDILRLITEEYMTPVKIALMRGTSTRTVYKTIKILKEKGLLNYKTKKVHKKLCTQENKKKESIRLHAQEFSIKLIKKGKNYNNLKSNANTIIIDDNTIRLYNDSLEIYSGKSFYSDDVTKATYNSFEYWNKFFKRLENDLDVLIVKNRHQNIKLVKHHYASINNGMAKEFNEKKIKIRLYATEDNKMWFELDFSLKHNEAETTHLETAERDMQLVVNKVFNDLRDSYAAKDLPVPIMSEIVGAISILTNNVNDIAIGLKGVVKLITPPKPPIKEPKEDFIVDYVG